MKKYVQLMIIFFSFSIVSQTENRKKNTGFILGKIIDSKSKLPLDRVNIICKNKTKTFISGGITNKKGVFKINKLPLDSVFIDIQFIGYKTIKRTVLLSKNKFKINLENIYLEENNSTLD